MSDKLPVLYAAIALDPDTKLKYFEIKWADRANWVTLAKQQSKELWEAQYQTLQYVNTTMPDLQPTATIFFDQIPEDLLSWWKQTKRACLLGSSFGVSYSNS